MLHLQQHIILMILTVAANRSISLIPTLANSGSAITTVRFSPCLALLGSIGSNMRWTACHCLRKRSVQEMFLCVTGLSTTSPTCSTSAGSGSAMTTVKSSTCNARQDNGGSRVTLTASHCCLASPVLDLNRILPRVLGGSIDVQSVLDKIVAHSAL